MNRIHILRILVLAVIGLGAGLGLGACGDDDAGESSGQRIDVIVTDTGLEPADIQAAAGELRLEVQNDGQNPHALIVQGDEGEVDRFNEDLDPGESRTLRITVDPGTYQLVDTRDANIAGTLTVDGGTETVTQTQTQTETQTETEVERETQTVVPPTETVVPPTETEVETVTVPEEEPEPAPTTP